jgi:hypothetical protein
MVGDANLVHNPLIQVGAAEDITENQRAYLFWVSQRAVLVSHAQGVLELLNAGSVRVGVA